MIPAPEGSARWASASESSGRVEEVATSAWQGETPPPAFGQALRYDEEAWSIDASWYTSAERQVEDEDSNALLDELFTDYSTRLAGETVW